MLGDPPDLVLQVIGAILTLNGVHLTLASLRKTPKRLEILYFSLGDLAWWLGSTFLIAAKIWITTSVGSITAFAIALVVAAMGVAQLWLIGAREQQHSNAEHWASIIRSYRAMPKWVFVWLCGLNLLFLMSLSLWPDRLALVILIGFIATGPLLAGQIAFDGGLRRILGLGHLVPWLPLLVWLILNSDGNLYVDMLVILLAICLAFDLFDVWRFWQGDRRTFGKPRPTPKTSNS